MPVLQMILLTSPTHNMEASFYLIWRTSQTYREVLVKVLTKLNKKNSQLLNEWSIYLLGQKLKTYKHVRVWIILMKMLKRCSLESVNCTCEISIYYLRELYCTHCIVYMLIFEPNCMSGAIFNIHLGCKYFWNSKKIS